MDENSGKKFTPPEQDKQEVVSQMVEELEAVCEAEDHDLYCASIFKPEEHQPCDCHIFRIRKLVTAYWCGQQSAQPQSELLPCQECGAPAFWLPSEGEGWFAIDHLANCQRAASMTPLRQLIYLSRLSAQPTIESAEESR